MDSNSKLFLLIQPSTLFSESESVSHSVMFNSLQPHGLQPSRLLSMEFSRQDPGVGSHFLLQRVFLTQGLKLGLLHYRQIPYHLNHQGSPVHPLNVKTSHPILGPPVLRLHTLSVILSTSMTSTFMPRSYPPLLFFGYITQLVGSQFLNQGSSLGHGSESTES